MLWWNGQPLYRFGASYQELLDVAYDALSKNDAFKRALLASGDAVLQHTIGKTRATETVLTQREFCGRLTAIRERLRKSTVTD
jgi:hypothetical protein